MDTAAEIPATELARKKMRVMVALDESEGSLYALQWALDKLVNVPNQGSSMVTLVHVHPPFRPPINPVGPGAAAFYTPTAIIESMRKAQEENTAAVLSRALKMCNQNMVKAEALAMEGDAREMICEATEKSEADLLVVGSRGLGKIKSDYCAHHANCPILIVNPLKDTTSSSSKQ